jgi:UDP-glucose 4-epimerase
MRRGVATSVDDWRAAPPVRGADPSPFAGMTEAAGRGLDCTHTAIPGARVRLLLTGSSGRVGRAIFAALAGSHEVIGLDRSPFSTTRVVADLADDDALRRALDGCEAVVHTAGLHAPHVGIRPDAEFERSNVEATGRLLARARQAGVRHFVYTSTTALYGDAVRPAACTFIDESTPPRPRTIYHRTKLAAEALLESAAAPEFAVRIVRMSRCFPEPADRMAWYRTHRGIDVRDVAQAHVAALGFTGASFLRFIASAATPFRRGDVETLAHDPAALLRARCPSLLAAFEQRGWPLPDRLDRIYDASLARDRLGWVARHGPDEVLRQLERDSLEVLPPGREALADSRE